MPVRKEDADRALELLESYHEKLTKPQDRALRSAIERVIRIFQSRLFLALLDIQEFYEATLLDGNKSPQQKADETLEVAQKWENRPVESEEREDIELPSPKLYIPPEDEQPLPMVMSPETERISESYPMQVQENGAD